MPGQAMMSEIRLLFGVASPASSSTFHSANRSRFLTFGRTRFCSWVTRISPWLNSSASAATVRICSEVASPGMPPIGFSETLTMA